MLDLGTSFIASVERDPKALAIVDGATRLTYAEWYRRISGIVAALDELWLKPGDHLLTAAQNRWEAATIHWACQFAGIIITPVNWRATADELDFLIENAEAKAVVYDDVIAEAIAQSKAAQTRPRIALGKAKSGETGWSGLSERKAPDAAPRVGPDAWSVMLYTSGTTAQPKGVPRRQSVERAAARRKSRRTCTATVSAHSG
jgi:2-furoate---CoA ligase